MRSVLGVHWKDWCWSWSSNTLGPDAKNLLTWKDPDAGKDWGQEEKGMTEDEMVGWHQWHQWTWVWVNSRSWWWMGRPGVLWFMGSQRVGHNWATELNWMRIYGIAQETLLRALEWPKREGNPKEEGIYMNIQLIQFAVQQKQNIVKQLYSN